MYRKISCIGKGEAFDLASKIRTDVFMTEQGFDNEFDNLDEKSLHVVILDGATPIATARAYNNDGETLYHIGRVAVNKSYRNKGLGNIVMAAIEEELLAMGVKEVVLSAQCTVEGFYKKRGYCSYGEVYLDEHCPHIDMKKVL